MTTGLPSTIAAHSGRPGADREGLPTVPARNPARRPASADNRHKESTGSVPERSLRGWKRAAEAMQAEWLASMLQADRYGTDRTSGSERGARPFRTSETAS